MRITEDYQKQQEELHQRYPNYGTSGHKWAEPVKRVAEQIGTRDIIDYGSGKQTLQKSIPWPIQNYDPCIKECSQRPIPADLVVCGDVLEHIEPECLDDVLADLASLAKKAAFLVVATRPAIKFLEDGRNAHLIQESSAWWMNRISQYFTLQSFQNMGGEFILIVTPKDE